jgi:hypothetical protein
MHTQTTDARAQESTNNTREAGWLLTLIAEWLL